MSESCSTFGLRRSSHGVYYQKLWILLFLKRAVDRKYSFRLYTEMESFAGFDDIVFQYEQNGTTVYRLIQVKHTRKKHEKINVGSLLTKSSELNLVKHFTSYLKIVVSEESRNEDEEFKGEVEDFVIATNIDFDSTDSILHPVRKLRVMLSRENKGKEISVRRINTKKDDFLNIGNSARYKIIGSGGNIVQYLKQNKDFINANLDKKNGKEISDEEIDKGVKSFLDELVFAVNLPSNDELCEIVKDELGKGLNNSDKENLFGRCMEMVTNWMNEENRRPLLFKEVKAFFKKLKEEFQEKPIEFNVINPVENFYGRISELEAIHVAFQSSADERAELSRIVVISGMKGVGKTELARKYVHDKKGSYDRNVIWINAESSKGIEESFLKLADRLEIFIKDKHRGENIIRDLVNEVYAFFVKRRCIFIFDNAQRYEDVSEFLPPFSHLQYLYGKRSYILITSYNKKWEVSKLPKKIKVIRLNELERTEALELVRKALNIQDDAQNEEIDKLTRKLQHFPLALGQAVAYICNKDIELKLRGHESFTISNYLEKCNQQAEKEKLFKETRELVKELSYDSEEEKDKKNTVLYTKAVLTTLSIAIEDIIQKVCGSEALNILEIMAYFTSDDIHIKKIFVKLVADNEEKLWDAVGLLNRYHIINLKAGIANIHELVQMLTRLKLEKEGQEEGVLKKALELINGSNVTQDNTIHVTSVWEYASKFGKLIDDFYFDSIYTRWVMFSIEDNNINPLHLLIEYGSYKAIKAILTYIEKYHPNKLIDVVNAVDNHGQTPLHMAAGYGKLSIAKYLVSKGANIHAGEGGCTPIYFAAAFGRLNVARYLASKGADPTTKNICGGTALHRVAYRGECYAVKYLVNAGSDVNANSTEPYVNGTPLHCAVHSKRPSIVKYLLDRGADVSIEDEEGKTPLYRAAGGENLNIVKCLVEKGADICAKGTKGMIPLYAAAKCGSVSIIRYFIGRGININFRDEYGNTMLHLAAGNHNLDAVEYLIKKGAHINARNKNYSTPLHFAAVHDEVVEYLIYEGAYINAKNKDGNIPLHIAAMKENASAAQVLLEYSTELIFPPKAENDYGWQYSADGKELRTVIHFTRKSIGVNFRNKDGNTPLHLTAMKGNIAVAKVLLKYNTTDVNIKNNEGMTALHYATNGNHQELVELLLFHGANSILEST